MRTLHLTTSLPYPPASGGAIRVHGIAEGLHQSGHNIAILCFHDESTETAPNYVQIETVPQFRRSKIDRLRKLLFSRQPDIAGRFYSDVFAAKLSALLTDKQFDLVQFEGIETVCYLPLVKEHQPSAKCCFDTFNAEYALQKIIYQIDRRSIKRWHAAAYSFLQVGRIKRFEAEMCRLADAVIAVSPEDAELLRDFRPDNLVHVVPNGIWVTDYTKSAETLDLGANALVFTGKMDYRPNVDAMLWFAQEIYPKIKTQVPDTQLVIVGQQPHARLNHLRTIDGIHITGWVDSVVPYLHAASVYVAPLRMGSGTRLKLLGAMAAECPIVATSTASAGLLPQAKQGMIIADDSTAMADAIIDLLKNPERHQEIGQIARKRVQELYDWSVLIPLLLAVYKSIGLED
jgi:polysaccharide biosynthesis protein PslH